MPHLIATMRQSSDNLQGLKYERAKAESGMPEFIASLTNYRVQAVRYRDRYVEQHADVSPVVLAEVFAEEAARRLAVPCSQAEQRRELINLAGHVRDIFISDLSAIKRAEGLTRTRLIENAGYWAKAFFTELSERFNQPQFIKSPLGTAAHLVKLIELGAEVAHEYNRLNCPDIIKAAHSFLTHLKQQYDDNAAPRALREVFATSAMIIEKLAEPSDSAFENLKFGSPF